MTLPAGALPGAARRKAKGTLVNYHVPHRRGTSKEEKPNEGSSVCQAHLRKVQDHQAQGPRYGHLRESQAQAEAGLI